MDIEIKQLIADLQKLQEKGITHVTLVGTLFAPKDGNSILATTEPQH